MLQLLSDNFLQHAIRVPSMHEAMNIHKGDGLTYVNSGLSCDTFNILYITSELMDKQELEEAISYYQSRNLEYCIWINRENLSEGVKNTFAELGITEQADEVGMALEFENYQFVENINHLNIRQVKDEESLTTYANVIAENWTPADQNV